MKDKFYNSVNKYGFYLALTIVFVYLLPLYVLGQNVTIGIHDNLDSNVVWYKVLAESGLIFAPTDAFIPNIVNGMLPRSSLGSEWNLIPWLYVLLDPFTAYVITQTLMHFIGFAGMYMLLKTHFLKNEEDRIIILGVSACFAILPFFPSGGLSVAGQPLALYAFLNIRKNISTKKEWIILCFIPFFSSFVFTVFFTCAMSILWLYDVITTKESNYKFLVALITMISLFLVAEYRLIYSMFIESGLVSHRVEFVIPTLTFLEALKTSLSNFVFGQYHASSLQQYFVGITVVIALVLIFFKKLPEKLFILLLVITAAISLLYGFWGIELLVPLKQDISLLRTFQFDRFYFLHPILWYLTFAIALRIIRENIMQLNVKQIQNRLENIEYGKIIVTVLLVLQVIFLFSNSVSYRGMVTNDITFREFFAEEQFQEIYEDIGLPQENYRVVSIGMHPSIAQYNGFYTLDGYIPNYPLEYKHEFRKIIEIELDKSELLKDYFDNWGSRCYIFAAELSGFEYTKYKNGKITNLELNVDMMKDMGCRYVLSAVEIANYQDNNLTPVNIYENENSIWRIFLYQII
jgi:hypothetical protein